MFKKQIKIEITCPKCDTTVEGKGIPGEKYEITCPNCNTKGYFVFPEIEKEKFSKRFISYFLDIFPSLIPHFILIGSLSILIFLGEIIPPLVILAIIPVFLYFKFDGRIPIIYTAPFLTFSIIALIFYKNESYANYLANYAYWLLVAGTLCLLIHYVITQKNSMEKEFSG